MSFARLQIQFQSTLPKICDFALKNCGYFAFMNLPFRSVYTHNMQRRTVVKYFYCTHVHLKGSVVYQWFSLENLT